MIALVLALTAALATAEQTADQQTGASRVALASVTDPRNRPLVDVAADDFVIQEGATPREILSVRPADYPIVLVLDTGSEGRADFALMQKAAAHFIERVGQRPIALATCGAAPRMLATFEDERQAVLAKLAALRPETTGASVLLEGAALAGETVRATGTLFSAVVVLSAAATDGSREATDAMIAPIVDSNAILHVIANHPSTGSHLASTHVLRALAEQSRGEFTVVYSAISYQAALDQLADRLAGEMLIEYLVPVGSKPNDVKVGIRIVGARIRGLGVAPR
ncbi:MAG: hypothetical protein JWL71_3878 [Acidobacteria bacterium]|nr:hypothetical protein [Acidobacteriota bacterium]